MHCISSEIVCFVQQFTELFTLHGLTLRTAVYDYLKDNQIKVVMHDEHDALTMLPRDDRVDREPRSGRGRSTSSHSPDSLRSRSLER